MKWNSYFPDGQTGLGGSTHYKNACHTDKHHCQRSKRDSTPVIWFTCFIPGCPLHTVIMQYSVICVFLVFLAFCDVSTQRKKKSTQTLAKGWGDDITWVQTYEDGLKKMPESKKPLMVIHHLEDCPHSKALKKAFSEHQSIQKMAKKDFIMFNLVHETTDPNLAPDGFYVPRILFVDPSMTVRADIVGKYANRMYTYEPDDMDFLAENMMKAKILLKEEHEEHGDL